MTSPSAPIPTADPIAPQLQALEDAFLASRQQIVTQGDAFAKSFGGTDASVWAAATQFAAQIVADDQPLQALAVPDDVREEFAAAMAADQALIDALRVFASHHVRQSVAAGDALTQAISNVTDASNMLNDRLSFAMGLHGITPAPTPTIAIPYPS